MDRGLGDEWSWDIYQQCINIRSKPDIDKYELNNLYSRIDIQEVRDNPDKEWDKFNLSHYPGITIHDVDTLVLRNATGDWNWDILSQSINIQEVRDHPYRTWNKNYLSMNLSITLYDVDNLYLPNAIGDWDWIFLSRFIDISEIRHHPQLPWRKDNIIRNISVKVSDIDTMDLINPIREKYCWNQLSQYIDIQEVRDNPELTWDRPGLSKNRGITLYDVDNLYLPNATGDWDWYNINGYIDMQQVRQYPDRNWEKDGLSINLGITSSDPLYLLPIR